MKNQFFHTTEIVKVSSYPYGSLKTEATFGLEFKRGKGFRTTFQTKNPKTGKLNNVKKSTYSPILLMYQDAQTGHIKYTGFDLYGIEGINKAAKFLCTNFDLFTKEQIQDICGSLFMHLKASAVAIVNYCGANFEEVKPILEPAVNAAIKGIKTGENVFSDIFVNVEQYEKTKVPGYNPFVVTTYQMA